MTLKKALLEDAAGRNVLSILDRIAHFKKMEELYGPRTPRKGQEEPEKPKEAEDNEEWLFI